ncbi:MAG: hypothetical protein K9J76_05290 [Polaromonas sp.]|nr:hypothetical protein [Polaromonas sp.]
MKKLIRIAMALIVAQFASGAWAASEDGFGLGPADKLRLQLSPYTLHRSYDEEHKDVIMVGLERERASGKLDGFNLFTNSFGQPSLYLYPWGRVWHKFGGYEALSFKWTAGLLYGYVDPYENKVPLNHNGFSPAAIIALTYDIAPGWSGQVNMLGTAALMFQLNMDLK